MKITITFAEEKDAEPISALLDVYARKHIVLARTPQDILNYLQNFLVARDEETGRLAGCVALREYGCDLNEIRSLAVAEECQRQGIGAKLVAAALELARKRKTQRVFALTLRPHFFECQGFERCSMEHFPEKVWADCRFCPKREQCDEIAVKMDL